QIISKLLSNKASITLQQIYNADSPEYNSKTAVFKEGFLKLTLTSQIATRQIILNKHASLLQYNNDKKTPQTLLTPHMSLQQQAIVPLTAFVNKTQQGASNCKG
ncbi:UNVERIFIED_CONTAM: hypothetical protein K2H54_035758, partial [Gekko kuhli]